MTSLLLEHNNRVYLTGRASIVRPSQDLTNMDVAWAEEYTKDTNPGFLWVAGKFVEADQANLNKQFWTTQDLEFGHFSVQYTPMNMLHKIFEPIGVYTESKLFPATETANAHIQALGCLWAYRYPTEAALVEMAHNNQTLWYSMECVGQALHCKGGCEKEFAYSTPREDLCEHLKNRTSVRHIVNPYFTGGAIIVPPTKPAWPHADVEMVSDLASEYAKKMDDTADHLASVDDSMSPAQWRSLMNQVITFSKRA